MPSRGSKKPQQPTESYTFASASRKNLPTEQTEPLMGPDDKRPLAFTPELREFDEQPRLAWARGAQSAGDGRIKPYEAHPLYAREKIEPHLFVKQLQASGDDLQGSMFEAFNGLPEGSALDWYRHDGNWQNRVIHGESARVMASLAGREGLAGQVQMIYFDPPYGMSYKSNFQVAVDDRGTAENRKGLPSDPQTIAAFRDTYEHGIHSYLDGMYERLALCRELLAETGSIFVQIGDENVLRMGLLLDEVFGAEHRVALIPYATSGSTSANTLPSVADFLLWYARDKGQLKYRQLYEPLDRAGKLEYMSSYAMVEEAGGTTRTLTPAERDDPDAHLPDGARLYRRMPLTSLGTSTTGRSEPYHWDGQDWPCPQGRQWSVSKDGMDRLAALGRLDVAGPTSLLSWKRYEEEVPGRQVHNLWHQQMSTSDKRYVVQTANSVIERCLLMSTDPGDLVLDPTCGGGTTSLNAERWGRRWITIDTSPVATAIARQRIATATFPYYTLTDSLEGAAADAELSGRGKEEAPSAEYGNDPAAGFVYQRVPSVSAATLAYNENPPATMLVDQPHVTRGVVRVASPFTVESETPWSYLPFDDLDDAADLTNDKVGQATPAADGEYAAAVLAHICESPIRGGRAGSDIHVSEVEPWPGASRLVSHRATYAAGAAAAENSAALMIASPEVIATRAILATAAADVARIDGGTDDLLLLAVAYEFAPDCDDRYGRVDVVKIRPHRDLQIGDLKPEARHQAFVMVGQPEIAVHDESPDPATGAPRISVEVLGYDSYNPATGAVEAAAGAAKISCFMLDTDHDSMNFYARRMHFPGADGDRQIKALKRTLRRSLDGDEWDAALSSRSAPFARPTRGCQQRSDSDPDQRSDGDPPPAPRSLLTFLVLSPSLIRSGLRSVTGPVGLAARGQDLGVVPEAVEQRRGELLVAEDAYPLVEGEVGGDDRRATLVAVGEEVEQQLAAGALEGHEAEFVDDQQRDPQVALMQPGERELVARLDQLAHEVGRAHEGDAVATAGGLHAERDREVRLAGADRPGDHDVLGALDVRATRELGELRPLDALQRVPVELLEGLEVREPRLAQQARYRAVAAGQHLGLEQLHEELLVVPAVVRGLAHQRGVLAADRGQLEFAAVRLEHGRACSPAHRATAPSRWS